MKGHFWYSAKQAELYKEMNANQGYLALNIKNKKNFASINNEIVAYTTMSSTKEHACNWDDMKYLGYGEWFCANGCW